MFSRPEPSPVSCPSSAIPLVKMQGNMMELKSPIDKTDHIATGPLLLTEMTTSSAATIAAVEVAPHVGGQLHAAPGLETPHLAVGDGDAGRDLLDERDQRVRVVARQSGGTQLVVEHCFGHELLDDPSPNPRRFSARVLRWQVPTARPAADLGDLLLEARHADGLAGDGRHDRGSRTRNRIRGPNLRVVLRNGKDRSAGQTMIRREPRIGPAPSSWSKVWVSP